MYYFFLHCTSGSCHQHTTTPLQINLFPHQKLPNNLEVTIRFLEVGHVTAICKGHPAHFLDLFKERRLTHILRFVIIPVRQ